MVFVLSVKAQVDIKGKFYTQVNMWEENSKIISTNYSKGLLIPVNTEVIIISHRESIPILLQILRK